MLDNFRIRLSGLGPVMVRIALGVVFIYHGWETKFAKLIAGENPMAPMIAQWPFVQWVASMFPDLHVAESLGWAAGTTEFVGGICVLLGLLTRFWSAGLVIQMAVAIFTVHLANGFSGPKGYEYPLTLGLAALALFLMGPGPLSLDYLLGKLFRGERANSVVGCGAKGAVCETRLPLPASKPQPQPQPAPQVERFSGNG